MPPAPCRMIPLDDDNPTHIAPYVTIGLIAACCAMFVVQLALGERGNMHLVYELGLVPAVLIGGARIEGATEVLPPALTLISSMFLHGGWMHLIGILLYLWIFGNNIEDAMGHGRFVAFYLVCGIVAAAGHAFFEPASVIPMIGASGAISGVLGGYALLYPHARVLVLIPLGFFAHVARLPAMWVLGLWFAVQIVSSLLAKPGEPGVAWMAHVGGFVAGILLVPVFKRRSVPLFGDGDHPRAH